jgi:Cu(I)/Ag(I) efflux system membrane fusion protein
MDVFRREIRMRGWFLALALVAGCGPSSEQVVRPAVPVHLRLVRRDSIAVVVEADARLVTPPDGTALFAAPMDAIVREVPVRLGARVAAGQLLMRLDAPDLKGQAEALRAQALAAEQDADRQRQLFQEGIAARRQVEEREAAARALVAQAEAAESLLSRGTLRSPLSGVVAELNVRPGERVAAGQRLAEVVDPRSVRCAATMPAGDLSRVTVGQPAMVEVEGSDSHWQARVEFVSPTVDSISNTGQVLLRFASWEPSLRPGIGGHVRISVAMHRNVLVVPAAAVVYVGNQPQVYVVGADSIARGRSVQLGARAGEIVEVRGDLNPGDRVVTAGAYGLPDSSRVLPRPDSLP